MVAGEIVFSKSLMDFIVLGTVSIFWGRELLQGFPNVIVSNAVGFSAMYFLRHIWALDQTLKCCECGCPGAGGAGLWQPLKHCWSCAELHRGLWAQRCQGLLTGLQEGCQML